MPGLRHLALLVRVLIEDRQRLALENVAVPTENHARAQKRGFVFLTIE